jgi:hypothetical protein
MAKQGNALPPLTLLLLHVCRGWQQLLLQPGRAGALPKQQTCEGALLPEDLSLQPVGAEVEQLAGLRCCRSRCRCHRRHSSRRSGGRIGGGGGGSGGAAWRVVGLVVVRRLALRLIARVERVLLHAIAGTIAVVTHNGNCPLGPAAAGR